MKELLAHSPAAVAVAKASICAQLLIRRLVALALGNSFL